MSNLYDASLQNVSHVKKPWGYYEVFEDLDSVSVKTKVLVVDPGEMLSLQRHDKRGERWVVMNGFGFALLGVDIDNLSTQVLSPGRQLLIPMGYWHRIINIGKDNLCIFEVQIGSICDESDIERTEDKYKRV